MTAQTMSRNVLTQTSDSKDRETTNVFAVIARIFRWVAVAMIVGGAAISRESLYPLLPSSYTMVLAGGATVLAASVYFQVEALRFELD